MPTYNFQDQTAVAMDAVAITPNDSADLPSQQVRAVYVGSGGNLAVVTAVGTSITLTSIAAGSLIPLVVRRVLATGTTATGLVGFL